MEEERGGGVESETKCICRECMEHKRSKRGGRGKTWLTFNSFVVGVSYCCPSEESDKRGDISSQARVVEGTYLRKFCCKCEFSLAR